MSYVSEYDALDDPATKPGALEGKTASHRHVMADRVWLVLARREYEKPLQQVGTVEADDPELARVYARSIYDEFAWIEMVVVPRDALVTVIES
ncbi:MAG TPA: hypothetical protein VF040_00755 [Ktedonobacterales bacterium]